MTFDRREMLKLGVIGAVSMLGFMGTVAAQAADDASRGLFAGINRARDFSNLSGLEVLHVPQITVAGPVKRGVPFEVTVQVGKKTHVMKEDHWIQWIELYLNETTFLSRVELPRVYSEPKATVSLVLENKATLKAMIRCNQHALWENSVAITPA